MREKVVSKPSSIFPISKNGRADDTCENFENFEFEIFSIDNLSDKDWRKPIVKYLETPVGNMDRKIKYRALSYVCMGKELFKKTSKAVLLKCLGDTEAYLAIVEFHRGACGAHQAGHKMKWLLFQQVV